MSRNLSGISSYALAPVRWVARRLGLGGGQGDREGNGEGISAEAHAQLRAQLASMGVLGSEMRGDGGREQAAAYAGLMVGVCLRATCYCDRRCNSLCC